MFMGNSVTNDKKLMLADGNLKTPSPLSSDSDQHGSSESLLSEINEVYQSIETNYPLKKAKSSKNLGIIQERKETHSSSSKSSHSSSPSSLKKRLNNIPPIVPDIPDNRSIIKDVVFDLQLKKNRIEEKDEANACEKPPDSPKSSLNSENLRMIDARARRRARLYTSSPEKSFRGTSSEDDRLKLTVDPTTSAQINFALKNVTNEDILTSSHQLRDKFRAQVSNESLTVLRKKSTVVLDPINVPTKRKKRRKDEEVVTSSSISQSTSPEPSHRKTLVPQLNLENIQSTDQSMSSMRDQNDVLERDREIDQLVETLSNISFRSTARNRSSDEEAKVPSDPGRTEGVTDEMKTFRVTTANVQTDVNEGISDDISWSLKPSSGVMDFFSRKAATQMNNYLKSYSNASTQVNIKNSLALVHESSKVFDRNGDYSGKNNHFSEKKSEDCQAKHQGFPSSSEFNHHQSIHDNPKVMATEVFYENKNWQGVSSSGDTTPHSTPSRTIKYPVMKSRGNFEENGRWAQSVASPITATKHPIQDRYSVFFVQAAPGVPISRQLQGSHTQSGGFSILTPNFGSKVSENQGNPLESDDERELAMDECFCLKFCNLFRYTSHD